MSDNTRIIHTGLYTDRAYSLLNEIIFDLRYSYKNAKKTKKNASLFNTNLSRAVDNEIILEVTEQLRCYRNTRLWNGLSDNQVLRHIVWMQKGLIQKRSESKVWSRGNNGPVSRFNNDFKICEVYFLYDMFHQRNNFKRNYPDKLTDELIGIPLDPITVELKNAQAAEIEKIKNETAHKLDELKNQKYRERDKAYKAIDMKYATLLKEAEEMAATKIKQLEAELNNIVLLNPLINVG